MHFHLEDISEEIPVDIIYILPNQTAEEYKTDFGTDHMGRTLRYKIVVKDGSVDTILYNTGNEVEPVCFVERRFVLGDLVKLADGSFAKILACPTGMLGRNWEGQKVDIVPVVSIEERIADCTARHIADLPGHIDLQIVMENGQKVVDGRKFALPVCKVEKATEMDCAMMLLLEEAEKMQASQSLDAQSTELGQLIDQFNQNALTDKPGALARMNELSETIRLQRGESTEYDELLARSIKAIRALTMECRFG
jgi:hypothetical protein